MKFPFIGPAYRARSVNFDAQRTINLYPEMSGTGTSKSIAMLVGCPGRRLYDTLAGGPIRGMLRFSTHQAIVVAGANVYKLTDAGVSTLIGTINADVTPVAMASNGTVIMLVTGGAGSPGYFIDPNLNTVTTITDADYTGADTVSFIDGYFIWNQSGTQFYQISGLYSTTIEALDVAAAEGSPDLLVGLIVDHREVWLFGESSTEVHVNTGNPDFPFERIQGAFIEEGCAAPGSIAKLDNTVYWLAQNADGQGTVQAAAGYSPQRVSDHGVEYAIAQYSRIDDAFAYTYQQEGHSFYVLVFPTANATWVFDTSTRMWHERAWRDPADGSLNRVRDNCHMAFAGKTLVGDHATGNIYELDLDCYDDNGDPLPAIRQAPHVSQGRVRQFFRRLWVDMETGVGLASGQGSDPQAMLQWSDDGGHTWSNELWASMGAIGDYKRRVEWRRLGQARDRIFRVTITDPVKRVLIDGDLDVVAGAS